MPQQIIFLLCPKKIWKVCAKRFSHSVKMSITSKNKSKNSVASVLQQIMILLRLKKIGNANGSDASRNKYDFLLYYMYKNGFSCMLCTYWIRLHSKTELMIIWIVIVCVPSLLFIRCFGYTGLVFLNVLLIRCYGHIGLLLSLFHNFSLSLWKIDFSRGDPVDHVSWSYPFLFIFSLFKKPFFPPF